MKSRGGNEGMAPLILNLNIWMGVNDFGRFTTWKKIHFAGGKVVTSINLYAL